MLTDLAEAFAVLFVTLGPIDNAVIFAALTRDRTAADRRRMALKATLVSAVVMVVFAIVGDDLLRFMGIKMSSYQIAGGILLLLVAIQMVISEPEQTSDAADEAADQDISIFPMALPLIAGPDAIVAAVVLVSKTESFTTEMAILGVLVFILFLILLALLMAVRIARLLGEEGMEVMTRLMGILLCALAVEFIVDGLAKVSWLAGSG